MFAFKANAEHFQQHFAPTLDNSLMSIAHEDTYINSSKVSVRNNAGKKEYMKKNVKNCQESIDMYA